MTTVKTFEKVDLGSAHNGRVSYRNVFRRGRVSWVVVRGARVRVIRIGRSLTGINFVTTGERV